MTNLSEARKTAKKFNVAIGKLTTERDSQSHYTLYEDRCVVAEGYFNNAEEIKASYINEKISNEC